MASPNGKKVAAVVVTYNRKELLLECLTALMQQTYSSMSIYVIDNASTDGTKEALEEHIKEGAIHYVNTGSNIGGAGGFNYGMNLAAKTDCEYIWVMDDDSMPHEDALEKLMASGKKLNDKYGFLSSKVLWTDESVCKMNIQKTNIRRKVVDFKSDMVPIISATFVSMLIPIKIVKEIGLPIKEFFIWCDDLEYSRRISRKYPCYLINSSVVTHETPKNIGSNVATDDYEKLDRYRYAYRNEMVYFRREGVNGMSYAAVRLLFHIFRVLKDAKDHKKERIGIILSATRKGFQFHPEIEHLSK